MFVFLFALPLTEFTSLHMSFPESFTGIPFTVRYNVINLN